MQSAQSSRGTEANDFAFESPRRCPLKDGGCVSDSETLPFAFRSTGWDDSDCRCSRADHDDRSPDSVYLPAGSPGNTVSSQRCLQPWLSNSVLPDGVPVISRQIFCF